MDLKQSNYNLKRKIESYNKIKKRLLSELDDRYTFNEKLTEIQKPTTDAIKSANSDIKSTYQASFSDLKAIMDSQHLETTKKQDANQNLTNSLEQRMIEYKEIKNPEPDNFILLGNIAKEALALQDDHFWGLVAKRTESGVEHYFGNKKVKFDSNNIIFAVGEPTERTIIGTKFLWELLTRKQPEHTLTTLGITFAHARPTDKETYLKMVEESNIHLSENGKIRSSGGFKYQYFIQKWWLERTKQPIVVTTPKPDFKNVTQRRNRTASADTFSTPKGGRGIQFLSSDPKVLFTRLLILLANEQVNHTNVDKNEVIAIADELYRQKHIDSLSYEKLII